MHDYTRFKPRGLFLIMSLYLSCSSDGCRPLVSIEFASASPGLTSRQRMCLIYCGQLYRQFSYLQFCFPL